MSFQVHSRWLSSHQIFLLLHLCSLCGTIYAPTDDNFELPGFYSISTCCCSHGPGEHFPLPYGPGCLQGRTLFGDRKRILATFLKFWSLVSLFLGEVVGPLEHGSLRSAGGVAVPDDLPNVTCAGRFGRWALEGGEVWSRGNAFPRRLWMFWGAFAGKDQAGGFLFGIKKSKSFKSLEIRFSVHLPLRKDVSPSPFQTNPLSNSIQTPFLPTHGHPGSSSWESPPGGLKRGWLREGI